MPEAAQRTQECMHPSSDDGCAYFDTYACVLAVEAGLLVTHTLADYIGKIYSRRHCSAYKLVLRKTAGCHQSKL